MWTAFAATAVTSSLFVTAMAPNLLAVTLVRQTTGVEIGWNAWFLGFLPVGALLFVLVPLLVFVLYPPEIKRSPEVAQWAAAELRALGPMPWRQKAMAGLALGGVALWIFGGALVNATTVVLIVISLMVVLDVVSWNDVTGNQRAWNVLIWFGTLVALADGLGRVGFVEWVAKGVAARLTDLPVTIVVAALVAFYFLVHYLFASLTAHTMAILPVMLAVGQTVPGLPIEILALLLCYSLGMMGVITPYATGPAPVYFGTGYISRIEFWRLGFIFGMIYLAALLGLGLPYLMYLRG
jgi:L-tartrate/succinate antiporter